mmetsp:Transcript_37053/g.52340  ORF Transcript_37053/g.52340 Transcript_37053/m.52340 type:complete len:124 (-) Transcript_37053:189-560(-)
MTLHAKSDASYLSKTKSRSRAAGFFYLSTKPKNPAKAPAPNDHSPPLNGAVSIFSSVLREIVSSTTEAELAALFDNGKEACPMRIALQEMDHLQPPTPSSPTTKQQAVSPTMTCVRNDQRQST